MNYHTILEFLSNSGKRFYLALYFSVILHVVILIYAILPLIPRDPEICGLEGKPDMERELVLNFELDPGDFTGAGEPGVPGRKKSDVDNGGGEEKGKGNEERKKSSLQEKFNGSEWEELFKNLENTREMRNKFNESYDNVTDGLVSQKYIKRYRHFEDMAVKDVFPTLDNIEKKFETEIQKSEDVLEKHNLRNEIIEEFRRDDNEEFIKLEIGKDNPNKIKNQIPLKMSEKDREEYLDKILKNSKEDQISEFVDKFSNFDPDNGDLPLLFRDLYYKNLQRLAYTFSSDPTYFTSDYFEENLNKEDYLRNSMALGSKWKGTKTSIEILFSILDIYEIQERALFQYYQNIEIQKNLDSRARKEIRNEAIRLVLEKYGNILKNKNIKSYEDITKLYHKKKISILEYMEGSNKNDYRNKDIYFEKGRIIWEEGYRKQSIEQMESAISIWRSISGLRSNGEFLNSEVYEKILPLLSTGINNKEVIQSEIMMRMQKHMESKRKREENLLWGK